MFKAAPIFDLVVRDGFLIVLVLLAFIVVTSLAYSLFLLLVAALSARRRAQATQDEAPVTRFLVLIPAHDEEADLPATLSALLHVEYPASLLRVVVVADNCSDATAQIAREAHAEVLVRTDPARKGKGYALNWALEQLAGSGFDLAVIMDADTQMDPGYLAAMERIWRKQADPRGFFAAQGFYDVLNAGAGWRAALMCGALRLVHWVRPLARERLRLSVGLKGNGMCLSAPLVAQAAWRGDSLTEDIEYGLDLVERSHVRVRFVAEAIVRSQMPTTARAASTQRRRWERGRYRLMRTRVLTLLWRAVARGDRLALDAALDLLAPPIAEIAAFWALWGLLLIPALLYGHFGEGLRGLAELWGFSGLALALYVLGGFAVGGAPREAYLALAFAPGYVVWKMLLYATGARDQGWVRTERLPALAEPGAAKAPTKERMEAVKK